MTKSQWQQVEGIQNNAHFGDGVSGQVTNPICLGTCTSSVHRKLRHLSSPLFHYYMEDVSSQMEGYGEQKYLSSGISLQFGDKKNCVLSKPNYIRVYSPFTC